MFGLDVANSLTGVAALIASIATLVGVLVNHRRVDEVRILVNGRTALLEKTLVEHGIAVPAVGELPKDVPPVLVNPQNELVHGSGLRTPTGLVRDPTADMKAPAQSRLSGQRFKPNGEPRSTDD